MVESCNITGYNWGYLVLEIKKKLQLSYKNLKMFEEKTPIMRTKTINIESFHSAMHDGNGSMR